MKNFTILMIFLSINLGLSQNRSKFRTFSSSACIITDDDSSECTEWDEHEMLVVFEAEKRQFIFYSENGKKVYDLISKQENIIDDKYDMLVSKCIDNEGTECIITLMRIEDEDDLKLIFKYSTVATVYKIKAIED